MKADGINRIILKTKSGEKFFGKGPYILLKKVEEFGSLNRAAKELGMSYSKAFNVLKNCEKASGKKFLNREIGGAKGGGSELTEDGRNIIKNYEYLVEELDQKMEDILEKLEF